MANYSSLSREELQREYDALKMAYDSFAAQGLKLDMSRGKPGAEQIELSAPLLDALRAADDARSENGMDVRNYGLFDGLPEMRRLFGEIMGVDADRVILGNNSSLNLMFDAVCQGMVSGFGQAPWGQQGEIKFLCPVPGYDRHFAICEYFGITMIPVPMTQQGPAMEVVEKWVQDPLVKGVWCVPMYSNPQGYTYSDETVRRFAALKPAAKDFRIFWDNSYCLHHLKKDHARLANIFELCKQYDNEHLVFEFTSTSKISFPGAGIAAMAVDSYNYDLIKKRVMIQTIGPDKVNQLRHMRYFKDLDGINAHMEKMAEILRPRFDAVLQLLQHDLADTGTATWSDPQGGYFISVDVTEGCAKRVVELCKQAGVTLTGAGATFPYGNDPEDRNIRLAPTFPAIAELKQAMALFTVAVRLAALEKRLAQD